RSTAPPPCPRATASLLASADRLALDCLELVIEAINASPVKKAAPLRRANLNLEKPRAFWRLIHERRWISAQQLLFVAQK
ncbi:MAG: hypothetical protein WCT12_08715, partial [Verrucomicrobiota bacterium]